MGRLEALALGAVLVIAGTIVATGIAVDAPFEYDEAAYAIEARSIVEGGATPSFREQHAPGLPALGALVYALGARNDSALRLLGLLSGSLLIVATWALARAIAGREAALIAAMTVATWGTVLSRSGQFMTDVPAAALLISLALVLWRVCADAHAAITWRIAWAAPAAAGAFALRYSSALPVVLLVATATALRPAVLRDRRTVWTALAGLLMIAPTLWYATQTLGAPWRSVTATARMAGSRYVGEGLVDYAAMPISADGWFAASVALVGLLSAAAARDRAAVFLVVPGSLQILALGLVAHGEPRFVLFGIVMLVVAGARAVARMPRGRAAGAVTALALIAAATASTAIGVRNERAARQRAVVVETALRLRELAGGAPCSALSAQAPVIAWYSGCEVGDGGRPPARPRYLVSFERMPYPPRGRAVVTVVDRAGRFGDATIYELPAAGPVG